MQVQEMRGPSDSSLAPSRTQDAAQGGSRLRMSSAAAEGTDGQVPSAPADTRGPGGRGRAAGTTYLAPDQADDGDKQQGAAQGEEDVLGVVHHLGQQHQLGVELLKGLTLHGPSLGREHNNQTGWGHMQMPPHTPHPSVPHHPCPKCTGQSVARSPREASISSRTAQGHYISQTPLQLVRAM